MPSFAFSYCSWGSQGKNTEVVCIPFSSGPHSVRMSETPILRPPGAKSWLIWKDPHAGKDWGQEKGTTEDEMVGWHHQLNGHGFGWTPGVGDAQGGLAYCGSWGRKDSDMTERPNRTECKFTQSFPENRRSSYFMRLLLAWYQNQKKDSIQKEN